jgi:hypothetical protein
LIATVRVTLLATPAFPMAVAPWPPAWLPDAKVTPATANSAQAAMSLIVFFMNFLVVNG